MPGEDFGHQDFRSQAPQKFHYPSHPGPKSKSKLSTLKWFQSNRSYSISYYFAEDLGERQEERLIQKRSLDEIDTEDFVNNDQLSSQFFDFEPAPKVSGLLRRVKRFGCWNSCIGPPQPYIKQKSCEDGSSCSCLIDLVGKIHGIACLTDGRNPLDRRSASLTIPLNSDGPQIEKKLQCSYKTCWTIEGGNVPGPPSERRKRGMNSAESSRVHKVASIVQGIYSQGKCNCGQQGSLTPDDVKPATLNHVHQREDYKFALSFKTFPTEDGKCVCRFGKPISDPSPGADRSLSGSDESASYSIETSGVRTLKEKRTIMNDVSRDIIQCGLNGCRHIIMKLPNPNEYSTIDADGRKKDKNNKSKKKPWYIIEMEKPPRQYPGHRHSTATAVQCNLKTCWRVEEGQEEIYQKSPVETRDTTADALRESFQLNSQQKLKLLSQRGKVTPLKKSRLNVQCSQGVCTWFKDSSKVGKTKPNHNSSRKQRSNKNHGEEIFPGKDGLCACHKAYVTYYNWQHR